MEALIAGIDLGGTNVRIALAERERPETFLFFESKKTPVSDGPDAFLHIVKAGLQKGLQTLGRSKEALTGVGCTIPGIVDVASGMSLLVTNLPGWDNYPIRERLIETLDIPVAIENDVNAAALGEYWLGGGKANRSIVYFTISTGIAAGIVIDGVLLRGANHAAGEMGFFMPDPRLLDKSWEPNGCLELTSAGVGLTERWLARKGGEAPAGLSAVDVFDAANKGDEDAREVITMGADYLAQGVIALATIIDPEKIILSGSIVQHQPHILDRICTMTAFHVPHAPEIELSAFEGDAPLVGALALAARVQ